MSEMKNDEFVKNVEDKDLEKVAGGINNKDKLMAYILEQKLARKDINQILRVVMCQPANLEYLDVIYDENGRPVEADGVQELMEFTMAYYDSLVFPEPEEILKKQ